MKFGPTPLDQARGAILAHSLTIQGRRYGKGTLITADHIAAFRAAGLGAVITAQPGNDDVGEDAAAQAIAEALASGCAHISVSAPFTGRVNIHAEDHGVFCVDPGAINAANSVDEAITIATLPDKTRVSPRQMLATIKIIPYAAPAGAVAETCRHLGGRSVLQVRPRVLKTAAVILTRTQGMKDRLLEKGAAAVEARLAGLGIRQDAAVVTSHDTGALAAALARCRADMTVILGGSATADRRDVAPAAVEAAGGRVDRFGMPVDPGNLLFIGSLNDRPVIGLPGCARSPKLNGADWVLERVVSGMAVSGHDIETMGVGGLLKEIPSRPQPRAGKTGAGRPHVSAILLAAGASRRMGGADKLLGDTGGKALLRRSAERLLASSVDEVIVVLRPDDRARQEALSGLAVRVVENPQATEGMGASLRFGMMAISPEADAVLVALADMPDVTSDGHNRLIAAFDASDGREIVRAAADDGTPGNPVLLGRRFFESLRSLEGDEGARHILAAHRDLVTIVPVAGAGTDLDSPEDWAAWQGTTDDAPSRHEGPR